MKTQLPTQAELLKKIRKPAVRPTKVERPKKGGGYNRKKKHKNKEEEL